MFNLFKRNNEVTKLYSDLTPGERIDRLFEEKIGLFLIKYDFRFIKSKSLFKRKIGEFSQEIAISKSKWNRDDEVCSFWLVFSVTADTYQGWHTQKYGTSPLNSIVTGFYHSNLKNWKTKYKLDKYNLSKQDNETVFQEIKFNLENVVLPLLEKFRDYESSADTLMNKKEYWWAAKIYDYYLMSGKPDKAKQALLAGKNYYNRQKDPQKEHHEAFLLRLQQK